MAEHPCCSRRETAPESRSSDASRGSAPEPEPVPSDELRQAAIAAVSSRWPFGPVFFLGQLGAFVRDKCPEPGEGLPVVEIHLAEGEILDLCHVIGVAPTWVALAVNELEAREDAPRMRTELVPYGRIAQVTVRSCRSGKPDIGFSDGRARPLFEEGSAVAASPEAALRAAATSPSSSRS